MEVSPRVWEAAEQRYGLEGFDRKAVADRVRYIADRVGVPMIDLTAPLAHADGLFTPVYYRTDSHWNARGQDVAARALSDGLTSMGLLPGCR